MAHARLGPRPRARRRRRRARPRRRTRPRRRPRPRRPPRARAADRGGVRPRRRSGGAALRRRVAVGGGPSAAARRVAALRAARRSRAAAAAAARARTRGALLSGVYDPRRSRIRGEAAVRRIMLVLPGLADAPLSSLGGRTPLAFANHPALDRLASRGRLGTVELDEGGNAGSIVGLPALLGLDARALELRRGP